AGERRVFQVAVGHGVIFRPHDLFQLGARYLVTYDRIQNVIQTALGTGFVAYTLEKQQRVDDAPARRRINNDKLAAQSGDLVHVAVPGEKPLIEPAHVLDKRLFEVQTGPINQAGDRPPELGDDDLFRFVY